MDKKFDINEYAELAAKALFWEESPGTKYASGVLMGIAIAAEKEYQVDRNFAYTQLIYPMERYWQTMRTSFQEELLSYKPKEWEESYIYGSKEN